jgi:hypothetical protein
VLLIEFIRLLPGMSSPTSPGPNVDIGVLMKSLPKVALRCDVEKYVIHDGTGAALTRPYAHVMVSYVLWAWDQTPDSKRQIQAARRKRISQQQQQQQQHPDDESENSSEHDDLAEYAFQVVEEQSAVAITTGITTVVPGLEIGLLSMREGERAIIAIPSSMGYPAGVPGRLSPNRNIHYDITVKSAIPVIQLAGGALKFTQKHGKGDFPQVDDTVSLALRPTNPVTQTKLKIEKVTWAIGSAESGPFDNAVLSMRLGELAMVFIDHQEHMIVLNEITPPPFPRTLRVKANAPPMPATTTTVTSGAGPSPSSPADILQTLDVDPSLALTHLESPADSRTRFQDVERRREIGKQLMASRQYIKAAAVYRRACAVLLAEPALVLHKKHDEEAKEKACILLANCGRAQLQAGLLNEALHSATSAVAFNGKYAKAVFLRAQVLRRLGRLHEALVVIQECDKLQMPGLDLDEVAKEKAIIEEGLAAEEAKKAEQQAAGGAGGASS